jgi:uncharacterized protein (TIGR02646 family)
MIRIRRLRLPSATRQALDACAARVRAAPTARARRALARRLWKRLVKDGTLQSVRATLRRMAPGVERCMYCEASGGALVDSFRPRRRYPRSAFRWRNLLLACGRCHSDAKRDRFPRDASGRRLLLDPTRDDPREHLTLSPGTGRYEPETPSGDASIAVFGLNRGALVAGRRDAWGSVEAQIIRYANAAVHHDAARALDARRTLCRVPHVSVFVELLTVARTPVAAKYIAAACLDALAAHPDITTWVRADGSVTAPG